MPIKIKNFVNESEKGFTALLKKCLIFYMYFFILIQKFRCLRTNPHFLLPLKREVMVSPFFSLNQAIAPFEFIFKFQHLFLFCSIPIILWNLECALNFFDIISYAMIKIIISTLSIIFNTRVKLYDPKTENRSCFNF